MAKPATRKVVREDPVSRAFGDRVRILREQANLTLEQFSKQSGVSRAMLSKVERGEKSPTIGVARRIALALETSFSTLMGDDDAPRRAFAVVRKDQRQIFRDSKTGFERFLLSPVMAGMAVKSSCITCPRKPRPANCPPTRRAHPNTSLPRTDASPCAPRIPRRFWMRVTRCISKSTSSTGSRTRLRAGVNTTS